MEIGENILLLDNGEVAWTGSKDEIMHTDNKYIENFIFASPFLKKLKNQALDNYK
jgi:phospholipid/cholesterol/gamma-HCH transport system ATP-binding protein